MSKPPKRPRDPNQLAKAIVDIATNEKNEGAINDRASQSLSENDAGGAIAEARRPNAI